MRIISGKYRGTKLFTLEGLNTRPTLDRVKESLFNILNFDLQNAVVLDLFSGSGALGLEALSRGAKEAFLCDNSRAAVNIIRKNVQKLKLEAFTNIINKDFEKALQDLHIKNKKFDIIFLDPPYDSNLGINSLKFISDNKNKVLSKDGIIIYETDKNFILKLKKKATETVLDDFENLECYDKRHYGNVVLRLYRWRE